MEAHLLRRRELAARQLKTTVRRRKTTRKKTARKTTKKRRTSTKRRRTTTRKRRSTTKRRATTKRRTSTKVVITTRKRAVIVRTTRLTTRRLVPTTSRVLAPVKTAEPRGALPYPTSDSKNLPAAPQPSVLLLSDSSFSLAWGTPNANRWMRSSMSRYWDSYGALGGFLVGCFPVADLSNPVPLADGRSHVTPFRAVQVDLTPAELAVSRRWMCELRSVGKSGAEPSPRTVGVDLDLGRARVDGLRASAERFWDFNAPRTVPEGIKSHHSLCADPDVTAAYVPSDYLVMTVRSAVSPVCPPGSPASISLKPLHLLDFRGRTGLLGFETDATPGWPSRFELYLVPIPSADGPAPGHGTSGLPASRLHPAFGPRDDFLRLQQVGGMLTLSRRWTTQLGSGQLDGSFDTGFGVPGLRRPVLVRASKGRIEVRVSGRTVIDAAVPGMGWDMAQAVFVVTANDTMTVAAEPVVRVALDNLFFGGEGAAQPKDETAVQDFPASTQASYRGALPNSPAAFRVQLASDPAAASMAVLHFQFNDFRGQDFHSMRNMLCILAPGADSGTAVSIYGTSGGRTIPCASPVQDSAFDAPSLDAMARYGVPDMPSSPWLVRLDPSWLAQGENTFVFHLETAAMLGDLHVELTYPLPAPAYTPPAHWLLPALASDPEPTVSWAGTGPACRITSLAGTDLSMDARAGLAGTIRARAAMAYAGVEAWSDFAGYFRGSEAMRMGIGSVRVLANGREVRTWTYPGNGVGYANEGFDVDLAGAVDWAAAQGAQTVEVEARCFDSAGNGGYPVYTRIQAVAPQGVWPGRTQAVRVVADLGKPSTIGSGIRLFPVAQLDAVPVPQGLEAIEDDRMATLIWRGRGNWDDFGSRFWDNRTSGYQVTWYPVDNPAQTTVMSTPNRAIQIQPLLPGVVYGAYVQTVSIARGMEGRMSAPSAEIRFQSNSARVDELRRTMNGFFDDFNLAAGPFDQTKWVTSYSMCSDAAGSSNFINGQFHAHNGVKTNSACGNTDLTMMTPALVTSRALGVFDFTGTTGTLVVDFDAAFSSNYWFIDITGDPDEDRFSSSGPSHRPLRPPSPIPMGGLRFHIAAGESGIDVDTGMGMKLLAKVYDIKKEVGIALTPNVRRPFVFRISKDSMTVDVSGVRLFDIPSGLNLPFERASVRFHQFANVSKANSIPEVTVHWDNFGFTSVSGVQRVVRQYRGTNSAAYRLVGPTLSTQANTFTIAIPDPFDRATGARVKFSRHGDSWSERRFMDGDAIICFNSLAYTVWGRNTTCRRLIMGSPPVNTTMGRIQSANPRGYILEVPASALLPTNTLTIQLPANMMIGDVLVEVEYPPGYDGPYTQPQPWFPPLVRPSFHPSSWVQVGPGAMIARVGEQNVLWFDGPQRQAFATPEGFVISTPMILLQLQAHTAFGLQTFGKTYGIVRLELQVDQRTVQTWTFPAPGVSYLYFSTEVDLGGLSKGQHELFVVAWDSQGVPSVPDYDVPPVISDKQMWFGGYQPVRITVQ
ncbi:hypothetical protein DFJ74DRAFT_674044 [Hyaloraphidium curvatum]|nr:hypothetical protein DFJ74DRAFT_674044 [Hyaloraphidium curvatum]